MLPVGTVIRQNLFAKSVFRKYIEVYKL